jgi:hypothetical protein
MSEKAGVFDLPQAKIVYSRSEVCRVRESCQFSNLLRAKSEYEVVHRASAIFFSA